MLATVIQSVRESMAQHRAAVPAALALFEENCGQPLPRVPGIDTASRLAVRLHAGRTVEEAAALEYLYRWRLALQSPVFGIPHAIGM
jgi:hypothetical protein